MESTSFAYAAASTLSVPGKVKRMPTSVALYPMSPPGRCSMELLWMLLFVIGWVVLQAWILPRAGVPT